MLALCHELHSLGGKSVAEENNQSIEWIMAEKGVAEVYTNFVHSNWSLYDVRLRLGQLIPDPKITDPMATRWVVEEHAAVPSHGNRPKY